MFEFFIWPSVVDAFGKLPKEAIIAVAAGVVVIDIHKRNCDTKVKIAVAEAEVRKAELEVELEALRQNPS